MNDKLKSDQERIELADALIPWGTQTNAKRHKPEMGQAMPHFVERAEGCRVYGTNGKTYIDYRSSLGPIILGYNHPTVQRAVSKQLEKGVLFSMASPLEVEMAAELVRIIPGLDQVRFLKSGNEVNHVAVRLARAYTGKDVIVTCGYHGHGDWFSCGVGNSMSWSWPRMGNGVPDALDDYVIKVPYGDIEALEEAFRTRGDDIAGMITVPYDWNENVASEFLQKARELTTSAHSVLIFDQILTGFRLGLDGAQGFFDIVPDLTSYGKAIANGYPLAVVGGKREYMKMFDKVMITTTHAGETLSLAAGLATLHVMQNEPVFDTIWRMGKLLQDGFNEMATARGLSARSFGLAVAPQFKMSDNDEDNGSLQTAFDKYLFEHGVFPSSPYLMNYAHGESEIAETLSVMSSALDSILVHER